ncbi:MAG TPA: TIR domain-containing protein [Lacibacter sp.]|nr:TIR domain-containing protein [Lacibacter sp.]HMO90135.1 TIR domain-containing protein [Lacibacter sp.]HMP85846.1 TIR domain-containing protein [Lacibacter sp.]
MATKHRVFISYHHANDQWYKEELLRINRLYDIFIDLSVDTGDINENLDDNRIREIIRDDYLKDSSVTIVLVGTETKKRKHVDWEIYSSMFDGRVNKKSGVLVINLPTTSCTYFTASHSGEKERIYPENKDWITIDNRNEYERRYPYMPDRIIDNLLKPDAKISVVNWNKIINDIEGFRFLIDQTFNERISCNYDLSRPMRRANS